MNPGFTKWDLLALLVICLVLSALLFPVVIRNPGRGGHRSSCQNNLKAVGLAFAQYIQDSGEHFPPTRRAAGAGGWPDSLSNYLKDGGPFECFTLGPFSADPPGSPRHTDYFYNLRLSGRNQSELTNSANTILNGDGENEMDALSYGYAIDSIPVGWDAPHRPRRRHLDGANFSFADGHVKWLRVKKLVSTAPTDGSNYTFSLK